MVESTVFGGIAGDTIAEYLTEFREGTVQDSQISEIIETTLQPFKRKQSTSIYSLRDRLKITCGKMPAWFAVKQAWKMLTWK